VSHSSTGKTPTMSVVTGTSLQVPASLAPALTQLSPVPNAFLPPRLAQPASLAVGWISADGTTVETTGAPAASPALGMIVPGRANGDFMVYGPNGTPLVVVVPGIGAAEVLVAPGSGFAPGTALSTVLAGQPAILVGFVEAMAGSGDKVAGLTAAIAEAQTTILPPASGQMANLASYVGQPLMLAQISLACNLQGPAAVDQTWTALTAWLEGEDGAPPTAGIGTVKLPVSLGLPSSLNDGLVGFWLVGDGGKVDFTTFYAPTGPSGNGVALPALDTLTVTAGSPGKPVSVLLLFDPRGSVSAISGVLPVQTLTLPSAQFAAALGSLSVAIPVGPVPDGGTPGVVTIPLPALSLGTWSWTAPATDGWSTSGLADATLSAPLFPANPQLLAEGWLVIAASGDN
jgi:hypothetical protein